MPVINEEQVRAACAFNQSSNAASFSSLKKLRVKLTTEEILGQIALAADTPLQRSFTLPREAYISDEFHAWEIEEIFRKEWLCLAHVSQLKSPGDFMNLDVFGTPIVVVKDKSGDIRVLSRTCPHRAMDIMPPGFGYDGHGPAEPAEGRPGCGHTRLFICPYHSWTFELDGRLKGCPEMQQAEGFKREDWSMKSFRSEIWNGLVFVNFDGAAPLSVAEQYAEMGKHLAKWNIADMELVMQRDWEVPCNWKVLTENFMESYHHLGAHAKTLQTLMPAKDTWTEEEKPHYIRCHLPYKQAVRQRIEQAEANGENGLTFPRIDGLEKEDYFEWGLFLGHPLFTFAVTGDQFVWYRIFPDGADRLKLMTTLLVPKQVTEREDFEAMQAQGTDEAVGFHIEDMEAVTAVQRSFYGDGYQIGRLSHLEMPIWLMHRYIAARARGTWPTLDRPAAASQRGGDNAL